MGAQQGKERPHHPTGVGGASPPPVPAPPNARPPAQVSRIKGLKPRKGGQRSGANIFTEHNGKLCKDAKEQERALTF